jgi:hypothetical protein
MKTSLPLVALLLSSLSLGLQLQKKNRSIPTFDKYLAPAKISEYEFRTLLADKEMIRDSVVMNKGIGVPFVHRLSDDHQRIICRALVSEDYLPKSHDERRQTLIMAAWKAAGDVVTQFGLPIDDQSMHAVTVEFLSIEAMAKDKPQKERLYAEFADGEITFH